ncbi:hypothetical protein CFC21_004129 [Triticum aestivum]|uniref:rRNA N-glycosidase n=1 Tax=Triticum aestivum TaxID=4565 RepID=A0A3B5Y694_WHEAT|nr:hypothetical protein CFC21_004129 [Triticum aestivum]
MACHWSAALLWLWAALLLRLAAVGKPPAVVAGPVSRAEEARLFHMYYGQGFKVIKNAWDGKSYLLMQLLGVLENLKGITSPQVASQCVLQAYATGNVQLVNRTDTGCNFTAYVPFKEDTPLQRAKWIKYLGTFTNSEDRANAVYDALCLSKAAAALSIRFKPIVAWVEFTEGVWTFVRESYKLQIASLRTVDVVIDQTYASDPAEYKLSTFLDNIDVGRDSCFSFITNQSIWRFDKRIGNSKTLDWSDGAISQPQLVLADQIEVFFRTGNYTTVYFRNLAKICAIFSPGYLFPYIELNHIITIQEEGVTEIGPEMCTRSISTAMEPTILPCQ